MRILMLSKDYLPNIGGIATHVSYLSRALNRRGHDVVVLNPVPGPDDHSATEVDCEPPVVKAQYSIEGMRVHRVVKRICRIAEGLDMAKSQLGRVDIVHQHDIDVPPLTLRRATRWGSRIPWVWTNHTSYFLSEQASRTGRVRLRLRLAGISGAIAVSKELQAKTIDLYGASLPVTYIPNGVDPSEFRPDQDSRARRADYGLSPDAFVVLCPRRMVRKNGVIYLAYAVRRLLERRPNMNMVVLFLGDQVATNTDREYIGEVKNALVDHAAAGRVRYLGNVPYQRMRALYPMADAVVIPSLVEAVSLAALEAMASARPVIASATGGLIEIVRDRVTGLLVPPGDVGGLERALHVLYESEPLRRRLGEEARAVVLRGYTWDMIAEATEKVYAALLGHAEPDSGERAAVAHANRHYQSIQRGWRS